jgi:hypothetical protein
MVKYRLGLVTELEKSFWKAASQNWKLASVTNTALQSRKGFISVLCGLLYNFKGPLKIKERFVKLF